MQVLKWIGGIIAAIVLIKIAFGLLAMLAGLVKLLVSVLFLVIAIAVAISIFKFVFRALNGEGRHTG
ncbi:MAG: hypothetical protein RMM98_01325 [Acidobacteriota bacterium]|nr:hypothetical protein [Blastocatellia bacterium]MDW8238227.1 hypothetical protein [Acidobacteriota bacterium]